MTMDNKDQTRSNQLKPAYVTYLKFVSIFLNFPHSRRHTEIQNGLKLPLPP